MTGDGGAIWSYMQSGSTTLTDCTLSNNSAYAGGAIFNRGGGGSLTLTGCSLMGNSASFGGAIWNSNTTSLINSTISGNSAMDGGGVFSGVAAAGYAPVADLMIFNECVISANSAIAVGGGIPNGFGGGIFNNGEVILSECTVSGNSARTGAGIADICQYHSNTAALYLAISSLSDCTVTGNSATSYGGGMENEGTLTLTDCTVSGNSAANGGGIANPILSQTGLSSYGGSAPPPAAGQPSPAPPSRRTRPGNTEAAS